MSSAHDEVLTHLHEEHRARLERIVNRRVRDHELAADLVSEAFVRLHRQLAEGRTPDDPAAWLTRVALNLAASEGRHRQVAVRVTPRIPRPRELDAPDDQVIGRDLLRRVVDALAGLSGEDRSLVLAAAAGASGAHLAATHGTSTSGARVRLYRARRRLREAVPDLA